MTNITDTAAIAHEIKNLLAGITGAITVLFDGIDPDDPKKMIFKEILSYTERLDKTVRELLNSVSPVEGNKNG